MARVDDGLLVQFGVGDVVDECPADAAAGAGVDESVLRAGVEGVLPVDELRVEDDVALLALRLEVGKPLPGLQVPGACDGGRRRGGREVGGPAVVMAFGAEDAVDVTVLMAGQAHIIDVGRRVVRVGHGDRFVPEAEVVDAVGTFRHGEEALAVGSLDTHHEQVLSVPLHCAGIEGGVHHDALHEVRIGVFVQVVPPLQRRVLGGQYGMGVAFVNAVAAFLYVVGCGEECLVTETECVEFGIEGCHVCISIVFCYVSLLFRPVQGLSGCGRGKPSPCKSS